MTHRQQGDFDRFVDSAAISFEITSSGTIKAPYFTEDQFKKALKDVKMTPV